MSVHEARAERLAALLRERELDSLLVTHLLNVRYLTGFGGTNGVCVIGPDTRLFFTDFRYTERAATEVDGWELADAERELLPAAARQLTGRAGFDDEHLSVKEHVRLIETIADGVEAVAAGGMVEDLRRRKEPSELERVTEAARLSDEVYRRVIEGGLAGRSESDVARSALATMRELGAEPSFPPIVAGGPNGALPHAEPGDRVIGRGELVVFDMGAELEGYCSDCTRTFAAGEPADEARAVYELVEHAQAESREAIAPGLHGKEADAVARRIIEQAGHGDRFGHGLGHGVGMEVHEAPRLSPTSEDTLLAGDVVTVEPGIYLPGELGVRIEDLVVVEKGGPRVLTSLPRELTVTD